MTQVPDAHRQHVLPGTDGESFDVVIRNLGNENYFGFDGWSYEFTIEEIQKEHSGVRNSATSGIHISREKEFRLVSSGPNLDDILLTY